MYRGTGAYDPEAAIGGGTPANWSEISSNYQYYTCTSSSIRVTIRPTGSLASSTAAIITFPMLEVILIPQASAQWYNANDLDKLLQLRPGNLKRRFIRLNALAGGSRSVTLKMATNFGRVWQHKPISYERLSGVSSTPVQDFYWGVYFRTHPGLEPSWPYEVETRLNYRVKFRRVADMK